MAPRAATSASQTDGELPKIRHSSTELLLLCVNCQVLDLVANPKFHPQLYCCQDDIKSKLGYKCSNGMVAAGIRWCSTISSRHIVTQ